MKKETPGQPTKKKILMAPNHSILSNGVAAEDLEMQNILVVMEKLLHWAAIIESSDDAIISMSVDGYITSWNRGAQRLYGYTPEDVIGNPVSILMPPQKKNDFPFMMKQLHEGKRIEHYETERMTKDGRLLHVSITVSPIRDSHGNIIGASKIARDITERVENEKRRDEFVSTTSHELKTPITSQKVFGELLEQKIDQNGYAELKPLIQKMNMQTDKLTNLVEDLLELSRVQTARLRMENKRFAFDDLVDEIVDSTQMISSHKIVKKGQTGKVLKGDRERIGQVITNLLSNAIKYSPKADKVVLTTKVVEDFVQLSVEDFGIGIPKEYNDKIFERFFRVTDDDQKTYPGMGIGLFLCREIITRHEGNIWMTSERGKGSTFSFSLPFVKTKKAVN